MQCLVCFTCKEYVIIENPYQGKLRQNQFKGIHSGHPTQIINEREIGDGYTNVTKQIDQNIK